MNERDSGQPDSGGHAGGAVSLAFDLARGGSAKAEAYLDRQTTPTRLQIEDLKREAKLRHWSLRIRHVSDVLKLAFEPAVALMFIAIVAIIAGTIRSTSHDNSLVIDAFKVPPDMAAKGLTGDVVAASLLDRLTALQDADPLEMWGEALIARNRSDLALAKFEDANKCAPSWGRLHLKWGEALWWTGDKASAQKQFATAAHLDLTPSEKVQLARMEAIHG